MSYEPESPRPSRAQAAERVKLPAIFLIVAGALTIFWGGYLVFTGIAARADVGNVKEQMGQMNAQQKQQMQELEKQGFSVEGIIKGTSTGYIIAGVLALRALAMMIGGIMMLQLKGYGLAVLGSVLALLPCLTPCCVLGMPFGIWALVVLNNAEVKAAFR
jgi:hypothetical protein